MKMLCLTLAILTCSGCTLFSKDLDKAAKGAGQLVTFYCNNVTEPTIREQFRVAVNEHARPHSVSVACVYGGEPLIVAPSGEVAPLSR